jgi:hypothetical protein
MGLGIGCALPAKAAIVVARLLLAFGWTVALAGVAVWAYRRDEGRRFSQNFAAVA